MDNKDWKKYYEEHPDLKADAERANSNAGCFFFIVCVALTVVSPCLCFVTAPLGAYCLYKTFNPEMNFEDKDN